MTSRSHGATASTCLRCGAVTDDGLSWCLGCRRESEPSRYRRVHLSKEEAKTSTPSTALHGAGSTKETPTRV